MSFAQVDLKDLIFLVSSFLSGPHTLSPSYSVGSLNPEGRALIQSSHLNLSVLKSLILYIMSGFGSLYLLLSAAGGSFSNDG